ncbi:hypothetical protein [Streptomyces noursei]|uniref:hypothetical protein n=1 Tax=Streptomyces noursei TaxID=1971 RepID=UPI001962D4AE|nr:hypothetical protein [Streptomyces noursei]QRX90844.1 hypothetical protein JNO44_08395 [Streptomyces noursei]
MSDTSPKNHAGSADDYADQIRALVDAAPPLSVRQRERLRLVFHARPRVDTGTRRAAA